MNSIGRVYSARGRAPQGAKTPSIPHIQGGESTSCPPEKEGHSGVSGVIDRAENLVSQFDRIDRFLASLASTVSGTFGFVVPGTLGFAWMDRFVAPSASWSCPLPRHDRLCIPGEELW